MSGLVLDGGIEPGGPVPVAMPLEVDGTIFQTPSGAGNHVKGTATNGWAFWRLKDGRKLADILTVYRGEKLERDSLDRRSTGLASTRSSKPCRRAVGRRTAIWPTPRGPRLSP
jgi:hypothetical protein